MLNTLETKWRFLIAALVGVLGGFMIGTVLTNAYVTWGLGAGFDFYDPIIPWFVDNYAARSAAYPTVYNNALYMHLGIVGITVLFCIGAMVKTALSTYDQAHFQSKSEMRRNNLLSGFDKNGFVYGKLTKPNSKGAFISADPDQFPHAMMIAPTGSGKGVGFVLPNLFHFEGSAVVLDVKGENFEKTSVHRKKGMGNDVWRFSPYDYVSIKNQDNKEERTIRSHCFNPLERIANLASTDEQYSALNTLADRFLVVEGESAKGFYQAGKRLFVASCLYAIEKKNATLTQAFKIMGGGGNTAVNFAEYAADSKIDSVIQTFAEMSEQSKKILDSYISVINGGGFQLWADPAVQKVTSKSDFDFRTFRSKKQTLYISVQQEDLRTLAPLIRLLFAEAVSAIQSKEPGPDEPHKVLLLLDEFDSLGRQQFVLDSIKTIRSFGGRYFIISQSTVQLDSPQLYGPLDRTALLAGAGLKIFKAPQDPETAKVLSEMLGKTTTVAISESAARVRDLDDSANISRRSEERPLMSPGYLQNEFPDEDVLILPSSQHPVRVKHIRWYEDHHFEKFDKARQGHALPYPEPISEKPVSLQLNPNQEKMKLEESEKKVESAKQLDSKVANALQVASRKRGKRVQKLSQKTANFIPKSIPKTSKKLYVSFHQALNLRFPDEDTGDWHSLSLLEQPKDKAPIDLNTAGEGAQVNTNKALKSLGIRDMSEILSKKNFDTKGKPVYVANHFRAVADIVASDVKANKKRISVDILTLNSWFDTPDQIDLLKSDYLEPLEAIFSDAENALFKPWLESVAYEG